MVSRHSHRHQVADRRLPINGDELLARSRYRQNRSLRWIDDRDKVGGIHHAQVRNREGPSFQIGRSELVVASLRNQCFGFAGNGADPLGIGV